MVRVYHLRRSHRTFIRVEMNGEVEGVAAGLYQVRLSKKIGSIRLLKIDPETGCWQWVKSIVDRHLSQKQRNELLHYLHQKGNEHEH